MKFVCPLYILIIVFAGSEDKFLVRCIADLEEKELLHLSQKLNALECLKLAQAVNELIPPNSEHKATKHEVFDENLVPVTTSSKECLFNLEQWNNDFPVNMKPNGRATMEMTLRWLGRPDLAKYVRENRRSIKSFDTEDYDIADTLEFPGHTVSRRHASKKDKDSHSNGKRKTKRKKKKYKKRKKKKRHHEGSNGKTQKAVAASPAHSATRNGHQMKKKENRHPNKTERISKQSICCSILFILFFITVCLVIVYFFYKRKRSKARGTRFKYDWGRNKEDKDTFTDCLEWDDDDVVCSCSDVEGGCTGKCAPCSRYDENHKAIHRTCSNESIDDLSGARKAKRRKERKRQRFRFLQKNFYNRKKEKDQENRDRKCVRRKNPGTIEVENEQDASRSFIGELHVK